MVLRSISSARQRGVVLVITLILLVIISMLSVFSLRSATSSETMSNNTRVVLMGNQAAEIALRYCEEAVTQISAGGAAIVLTSLPSIQNYASPPKWQDLNNWDSVRTGVFTLPDAAVNQSGLTTSYNRAPECVVERLPMANPDNTTNNSLSFVITARGFGPEVTAGTGRPTGGEFWLQSTIELNP